MAKKDSRFDRVNKSGVNKVKLSMRDIARHETMSPDQKEIKMQKAERELDRQAYKAIDEFEKYHSPKESKFDRVVTGAKKAKDYVKEKYKKGSELADKLGADKAMEMVTGFGTMGNVAKGVSKINIAKRAKWAKEAPINKAKKMVEESNNSYLKYKKEPSSISGVVKTTAGKGKGKIEHVDSGVGGPDGNIAKANKLREKDIATRKSMNKAAEDAGESLNRTGGKKISNYKVQKGNRHRNAEAKELKAYKNSDNWKDYVKWINKNK